MCEMRKLLFNFLFFLSSKECQAIGRLANVEGTDVYCHRNCINYPPECPEECQCKYHDEFYEDDEDDEDAVIEAGTEDD